MSQITRWLLRYGVAAITAVTAFALAAIPVIGQGLVGLIFFAVLLSAWHGGRGPGLVTTGIILALAVAPHVINAINGIPISLTKFASFTMFVALAVSITFLVDGLHAARRRAEAHEKWLAAVLTSIGDAVIATDRQGSVVFM